MWREMLEEFQLLRWLSPIRVTHHREPWEPLVQVPTKGSMDRVIINQNIDMEVAAILSTF